MFISFTMGSNNTAQQALFTWCTFDIQLNNRWQENNNHYYIILQVKWLKKNNSQFNETIIETPKMCVSWAVTDSENAI